MSSRFILCNIILPLALLAGGSRLAQADGDEGGASSLARTMLADNAWRQIPGRPDHRGTLQFVPLPNGTLDTTRNVYVGHADFTLKPNEGFYLPMMYWTGEVYADGSKDDPGFPDSSVFMGVDVLVLLDGTPIADSSAGLEDNYVDTTYYPRTLMYPEPTGYGSVGAYFVKGLAVTHGPLSPGTHTMSLLLTSPWLTSFAGFDGWDNTWTITVEK